MPLVAVAYALFAMSLLAAFGGIAWLPMVAGICAGLFGVLRRELRIAGLGLTLVAGVSCASVPGNESRGKQSRRHQPDSSGTILSAARARASQSIDDLFGDNAPMARALLIADQRRITPEMRDVYARAGMVHMLSISGLHVAIIGGAVSVALQAIRIGGAAASLLAVLVTGIYVMMIGAPAPAVRSAVMLAGVAASKTLQRPTSPWAGLALGAFVPLVAPRTVLDLGYQLSVVGIAGLIASASVSKRVLSKRISGWRLSVARSLIASSLATVITAPIIAWYFGRISLIAPAANLIAAPVISVLQPLLFLVLALAPAHDLAAFFADASRPLLAAFDAIAVTAAAVPGASLAVVPSLPAAIAGGGAVVALIAATTSTYPARALVSMCACIAMVVWAPSVRLPYSGGMEMHVLDVGQGDAILVRTDRGRWIIFDAGRTWKGGDAGRSTIVPYVKARGGSVSSFVLSHAHADHAGGAVSVLRDLEPDEFWDSAFPQGSVVYDATLRAARDNGVEWNRVRAGETMIVDNVAVRFLAPDSAWTASLADPNEASAVALVQFGAVRFLLVGDAEAAEEGWLLDRARSELDADVLKVGHHGSATSSGDAFLAAVSPRLAVISVGADNLYGHPSADVIAGLGRVGAQVLRTDESGTIVVRTDGSRVTVAASGESWDISQE